MLLLKNIKLLLMHYLYYFLYLDGSILEIYIFNLGGRRIGSAVMGFRISDLDNTADTSSNFHN
jgi:hypothetical protein